MTELKIKLLNLCKGKSWKFAADFGALIPEIIETINAQTVSEGFVLVPQDQAKDTERLNFLLSGDSIRTVKLQDIVNDDYEKIGEHFQLTEVYWIAGFDYWENTSSDSERGAIDKAMIEAWEQSHER